MHDTCHRATRARLALSLGLLAAAAGARAAEPPAMFGGTPARNMISLEVGLPERWDVKTGAGVKWRVKVGSQSYAGPVVHGGRVFVGTNNEGKRRPGIDGDKGVIMAFNAADGAFLWQATHDKLPTGRVNDWPLQGICSTPVVEGNRVYYVSNRAEVVAADVEGFRDGENDGPVTDEKWSTEIDGDIDWSFDLMQELDVFPHNLAASSPVVVGDLVFVTTGNGVDEGHINIPSPSGPSFIAVDRNTGKLVWESNLPGDGILHGTWSNAAYGLVNGVAQVVFPGGDGWVYAFAPRDGRLLWKFDMNPKDSVYELGGAGTRNEVIGTPVFYRNRFYVGVGQDPEHGEGPGHFIAIDATKEGDVTDAARVWSVDNEDFHRTISSAAIWEGVVYIADLSGFLYAFDAETGQHLWTHDTFAAIWGSPWVAEGRVYLGDEDGDIVVLKAGRTKQVLAEMNMGEAVYTTPTARDGVIYVASRSELFALVK